MTSRNKALGRNRGEWAAITKYLRGDVASRAGALYSAKNDFTSGASFDPNNWDLVLAAPTSQDPPTLSSLGGSKNTIGAGLPSFTGRSSGDIHYESGSGKSYVLTGVPGGLLNDTFTRSDRNMVAGELAQTGQSYTKQGNIAADDIRIVSGKLVFSQNAYNNGVMLAFPGAGGDRTIAVDWAPGSGTKVLDLSFAGGLGLSISYGYDWNFRVNEGLVTGNPIINSTISYDGSPATASMDLVGNQLTATLRRISDNAVIATSTVTLSPAVMAALGTACKVRSGPTDTLDNLLTYAYGTLAWTFTEPIYLQAQLVSGAIAVGTHVLKPGVRVPTDTTLREVILRCETAPTGAAITVQVERFNNGVSQGILGTATIAAGANVGSVTGLSGGCAKGDILKFNITSVGSTVAGSDLTVSMDFH